tara:strand:- start:240 stop:488 length:249 start_codon:yes stop_codon:yes gene_type:complete
MSSNQELVNRLTDEYRDKHLTLTTEEVRSFVENVIEETKKHIARTLVARRSNMIGLLYEEGYVATDAPAEVEELVLIALEEL